MQGHDIENTSVMTAIIEGLDRLFKAIGFDVKDDNDYNTLAELAENKGDRSHIRRGEAILHGCCYRIGNGLELWSILFENGSDLYYADCRPAFRGRYIHTIKSWELIEYDEDGEAIVRGVLPSGGAVQFELQNLTEVDARTLRIPQLQVSLAGLVQEAEANPPRSKRARGSNDGANGHSLIPDGPDSEVLVSGRILACSRLVNPITSRDLVWLHIDAGATRIEAVADPRSIRGQLQTGSDISAKMWLQGHLLDDDDVTARYEGVDSSFGPADFWAVLRRDN